ncbi:sodium/potassium-transporting ATPase subunit beta-1-interacting protein [Diabrotica virgifera virgifera]|uniref:Sodium/potassium-transporting ATPase subunit beta-1-interacting protein n=1 Tax=Diabrotica virgifera virgifera TaxID=50390 RepID=A0A6P7H287_DIAVI|nr:sodium/potassium-transporting ATPase subunit beta-1-interacting protein [Diabrotica virgifera virgifera]
MGICSRRNVFLSICFLQMVAVVERQVFDFLGFLWIPILVNFFEIIFIIFGFFGAYQYRPKYIIAYLLWHLFWIGWNIFMICLYLNVAGLDHEKNKVLKLDLSSDSWWKKGGPGCRVKNVDSEEYEGCLINYVHVEIVQAGIQCFLTVFNSIIGICLSRMFMEEDDTSSCKSTRKNKNTKPRLSLYSIEFSSQLENRQNDSDNDFDQVPTPVSPKPMTPRRVKRRSVMTRGSSGRHSTSSHRSHTRSSTRSRKTAQNPVTRLLEQQQKKPYDSPSSLSPIESPLSNYYISSNNNLMAHQNWPINAGHTNPNYQQSSQQSLNETEELDDLYNNRPASVRSSYSNFHGTRALNYSPPKHYHSHATPQVPQKRGQSSRSSMRSMAFLNNGPPAYTSHGQIPGDSETPM